MRHCLALLCVLCAAVVTAAPAAAHKTNLTRAEVVLDGETVVYRLTVSAHDLAVALGIETDLIAPVPRAAFEARRSALQDYLGARLAVAGDGQACAPGPPTVDYARLPDDIGLDVRFRCAAPPQELSLVYLLFFDLDAGHRALGRLVLPGAEEEFLFDRTITTLEVAVDQPAPQLSWFQRFLHILLLGVEHILIGVDHILFLLALLVGYARPWQIVKVVTAFTLAHSVTLGLAWFGVIQLPARLVEAAIALSIAYVALENVLGRGISRRWLIAGGFGLVHGLGFYAALRELDLGGSGVVTTLLAFNLGVEAGQLAIVGLVYGPLVWWLRQPWYAASARLASVVILAAAGWWTVERTVLG